MTTRCSKCAAELPDGMRFCGACGTELIPRCAACGTPAALAQQRFCGNCGAALQPLMPPPRERRLVSVLFCDLVGFTTFSESHDHEDVRDMLQQYFAAARRIIAGYGGTIEKFIGDAVMAVWGAPVAREDDAERSVRAALDLTTAVESLAERLSIPELQVRVGLLTGEAAVDIGGVQEGMVIGDAVNTAARIQSLAPPGSVLVDDTTRLVCESAIEFQAAGAHPVNGRSEPVRTWRAVRVLARPGGIRPAGAVEPPFVGRQAELATIRAALDGLLSPDARIRLVTVTGEAGTGKSRLARELERLAGGYAIEAPIRWHRGRAARFGEGAGLSALQEIVRMQAGITHDDDAERQRSLVEELLMSHLAAESGERDPVRRALHRLLDLDDGTEPIEPGELFSGWRVLWERLAGDGPVVMVCEELQSAGQALLDFVEHLLEWSPEAPILLLALSRPDDRVEALATMGERVALAPLTGDEMDQLVRGAVRDPPSPLLDAVRADGGGVPLYAVESLRALADRGVLVAEQGRYTVRGELDEIAVPPTIRALVASRLDRLGGLERKALTAGAVLGERFSAAAAAALSGLDPADADALLDGLVVKAILTLDRDPRSPLRGRYAFLQGVVRRVALDTLSRRDRKRLHLAAADHLSPEAAGSEATAARAGHLLAAVDADPGADDAKALRRRAGSALGDAADRAAAVGSLTEALAFLDRATELEADEQGRAVLLERAGAVAHRSGDAAAAAARYHAAADAHAAAGRVGEQHAARAHDLR
jgi:class 3 adenylate cyclase